MNAERPPEETRRQQIRQLAHDVNTHLAVVSMGIHALKGVREDADQFAEVFEKIRKEGIEPLKRLVADLAALACEPQE